MGWCTKVIEEGQGYIRYKWHDIKWMGGEQEFFKGNMKNNLKKAWHVLKNVLPLCHNVIVHSLINHICGSGEICRRDYLHG